MTRNVLYSSWADRTYRNRSLAHPQATFCVVRNTLHLSRAGRAYGGCPSACRPSLQGLSAEVTTECFPVLLFYVPFSTLRSVRRTRFYGLRGSIPHSSRVRERPVPRIRPIANFRQSAYWGSICGDIRALVRGYLHGVTSFQNLDGLLDSFAFFAQNYRNYLGLWHGLTAGLVGQGPLGVCGQPGVRTEFSQHLLVPSSSTLDGALSA